MTKYINFFLISLAWLLCQCTSRNAAIDDGESDYPSRETFAIIDNCMSAMKTAPEQTHQTLDSLLGAGLMSQGRCDYYHAMVVFFGEDKPDSALVLCDRLLDAGEFGNDRFLEEEICELASNISLEQQHYLATLRYANRGIALCHGDERMRSDEAMLMARVGVAEQELGRIDRAQNIYARAHQLLTVNTSFSDLIALISLQKKQARLYSEIKQYDMTISICQQILDLLESFDHDPSFILQRPETMQEPGTATHEFTDFYRCQIYCHIARAHHMKVKQGLSLDVKADTDAVRTYIEKFRHTDGAQSPDNLANCLPELYFLGEKTAFANAVPIVAERYQGDSLTSEYVDFLTLLASYAADEHNLKASNDYMKRAVAVSGSIRQRELTRMLAEQISLNMVQEQQLARLDAETQLERNRILVKVLSVILSIFLIASLIIAFLIRKNHRNQEILEMTQQDLSETKEEIKELEQQLEESSSEQTASNQQVLYERIEKVMREKKLYLDPELDLKKIAEAACSCRSIVSACINGVSGKSFRQWISEYRLSLFVQMLQSHPDESIDKLMAQCGYKDQSTFRRQFKIAYGMTVREYKRSHINRETKH